MVTTNRPAPTPNLKPLDFSRLLNAQAALLSLARGETGALETIKDLKGSDLKPLFAKLPTVFRIGKLKINVFADPAALNWHVAKQIIRESEQAGAIVLPADSTHGHEQGKADGGIYNIVNKHFEQNNPHPKLRLTHMDQLCGNPTDGPNFSDKIEGWLPNLLGKTTFTKINPGNLAKYEKVIRNPRVIVAGLGAEVPPHIAYIGEGFYDSDGKRILNQSVAKVKLREKEAKRRGVTEAITMGIESFTDNPKLEKVLMSVKGDHKADSVLYALKEGLLGRAPRGVSALGYLINHFKQAETGPKLELNISAEAFAKVTNDEELMTKLNQALGLKPSQPAYAH